MEKHNADIIIVDDNPYDFKLISIVLRDLGITNTLIHLHDGEEALDYFFSDETGALNRSKTGLVFLDIIMRKMGGIEVLEKLKSDPLTNRIPVLMFTSICNESQIRECYELGANSYIVKPTDYKVFESIIWNICGYWLGTDPSFPPEQV